MRELFAERGGDPDRPGKKDPLDPLLWRAQREGEPSWDGGTLGPGRPGWHIECAAIALSELGMSFDVQGGGCDLVFPHHEMSAAHAHALTGEVAVRAGLRARRHGRLRRREDEQVPGQPGVRLAAARRRGGPDGDPAGAARPPLPHDWEWTGADLERATARLVRWREASRLVRGPDAQPLLARIRERMADDLDAPARARRRWTRGWSTP